MSAVLKQTYEALLAASEHLDYCGYGDSWERECAEASNLEDQIAKGIEAAAKELGISPETETETQTKEN